MFKIKLLFVSLFSLAMGLSGYGQRSVINFKHYSTNDGLSQNTVYCILQDHKGFMWVGTEDGLNKFDGYDFSVYKHENENKNSLSSSKINAILEDNNKDLWVGTGNGLNVYDRKKNRFNRILLPAGKGGELDQFITSLLQDSRGNFWIGTLGGLILLNKQTRKLRRYYSYQPQSPGELNKVRTIFEDKSKMLWISIGNYLKLFDPVRKIFLSLPPVLEKSKSLNNGTIRVIKQDDSGNFWFGTEGEGLFQYDPETNLLKNYRYKANLSFGLAGNVIRDLFFRSADELWIGTRDGLSIMNTHSESITNYIYNKYDQQTISHNSIRHIVSDNAGNVWLGTFSGGLNLYSPSNTNFTNVTEQLPAHAGLNFPVVGAVIAEESDKIWIGTEGGGLNFLDRKKGIYEQIKTEGNKHTIIKSLLIENNQTLWIGTYDGLVKLDIPTREAKEIILATSNKSANHQIFSLAKTDKGLWIGTDGQGLVLLDRKGSTINFKKQIGKLSGNTVFSLFATAANDLWIGTEKGLNLLTDAGVFKRYSYTPNKAYALNSNSVSSIFMDAKGRLWVGTKGGGLCVFDKKKERFYTITTKNGLANDFIHAIKEDKSGNIWVSTNKGLSQLVLRNLAFPLLPTMYKIMNYEKADGLQDNQFSANAAAILANGEMFFGGINGLITFFPDKIIRNAYQPTVVFTDFLIKNSSVDFTSENSPLKEVINETKKITLSSDEAFFTLKFAALNFINPNKNKYAFKLEGFKDDDWHEVGNQRSATYTNLNAGKYVFKVKAANNDGIWNEVPTTLELIVLPPWFKTWWAYLTYSIIVFGLLYFYYSYSIKTASLKNELVIESRIRENDQELYQRKLNFFTNISHEIKTPLTLILSPLEKLLDGNSGSNRIQNQLMLMKRNGEHLVRLLNQLLDFRKFESGNMPLQASEGNIVRFVREVAFAFNSYATHLNITLNVSCDKKSVRLWFDRDKFEKIMYNLLSNAIKFTTPGGTITIYIQEVTEELTQQKFALIKVEDDGIGIAEPNIEKIFDQFNHYDQHGYNKYGTGIGLAFTKALVELHHGSIAVESRPAGNNLHGYTCFTVQMPMGKQHLSTDEIIANYKDSEDIAAYHLEENPSSVSTALAAVHEEVIAARHEETPIMLIVEDNKELLNFLTSHFEEKFKVHQSVNGKEGIEQAINLIPDIIISDVMMPEVNGTVLCSTLKADKRTSHIPIILLTARTPLIYKIEGLETGADDYITKPFSIKVVETRVWNLLASRQQLRERYRREVTLQPTNMAITLPDEIFLENVMAYIEKNMAEATLSVEDLGKEVNMSKVTLYRKIKALTNQTTIEFFRSVRLKKAMQYLETGNYSVSEVGYLVGFTDTDYFRKCFKEQFNKTPKEFSKKSKEN